MSTSFRDLVAELTVEDWRRVFDSEPLGWRTARSRFPATAAIWADEVLSGTLGNPHEAESAGGGRGNFLSGCYDRLVAAAGALGSSESLSGSDFVSGYGPFLDVVPLDRLGRADPVGDLAQSDVRAGVLKAYRRVLRSNTSKKLVPKEQLATEPDRIELALVVESIHSNEKQRKKLADELVDLCSFTSWSPDDVESCRDSRLRWLGYHEEHIAALHGHAASIGGREASATAFSEEFEQWFLAIWVIAGFLGVGSCGVAWAANPARCAGLAPVGYGQYLADYVPGLIGCGPGALGVAGVAGGFLGALGGLFVNGFIDKRTVPGTRLRLIGKSLAVAVGVGLPGLFLLVAWSIYG